MLVQPSSGRVHGSKWILYYVYHLLGGLTKTKRRIQEKCEPSLMFNCCSPFFSHLQVKLSNSREALPAVSDSTFPSVHSMVVWYCGLGGMSDWSAPSLFPGGCEDESRWETLDQILVLHHYILLLHRLNCSDRATAFHFYSGLFFWWSCVCG